MDPTASKSLDRVVSQRAVQMSISFPCQKLSSLDNLEGSARCTVAPATLATDGELMNSGHLEKSEKAYATMHDVSPCIYATMYIWHHRFEITKVITLDISGGFLVLKADGDDVPLTRKVHCHLWIHQYPPNCSDLQVQFLVAVWERRLPGFGIGAQLAGMCGLLDLAVNEKQVLVTNYYNRADHIGC
ncbi:hypothetical protein CKAN_02252600 [Cinnamomum micranthum f. kanehirae]|uniref:Uncharacterized protein n=1 Tax=Cinnamomum micranthum f. kanehirae TaxID=337451 RepID=A0A443PRC8_9MAGN|nr:hypothetical protein CKAN_02252600 [Cinnamomum micranthum f. kanehirae]